jgi:hypothetical protein
MASPDIQKEVIAPPSPPYQVSNINNDMQSYLKDLYHFNYLMWKRTGSYNSIIPDLSKLKVSVDEINSLAGISISQPVQNQLNQKIDPNMLGDMAYQNSDNINISGGNLTEINIGNILNTIVGIMLEIATINNSIITDSNITIKQGISGNIMTIGGISNINTNSSSNVGISETDMLQYNLPYNSLYAINSFLEIDTYGTFANNANNKTLKLYFGSDLIFNTGSIAFNGSYWHIKAKIIKNSSSMQQCIVDIITSDTLLRSSTVISSSTADLTSNNIIKCTGQGSSSNDVIQNGLIIKLYN